MRARNLRRNERIVLNDSCSCTSRPFASPSHFRGGNFSTPCDLRELFTATATQMDMLHVQRIATGFLRSNSMTRATPTAARGNDVSDTRIPSLDVEKSEKQEKPQTRRFFQVTKLDEAQSFFLFKLFFRLFAKAALKHSSCFSSSFSSSSSFFFPSCLLTLCATLSHQ